MVSISPGDTGMRCPARTHGRPPVGPNRLGRTRVLFDGVPSPIVYTSAEQISAIVPYGVGSRRSTNVRDAVSLEVAAAAPGIFTADASGPYCAVGGDDDAGRAVRLQVGRERTAPLTRGQWPRNLVPDSKSLTTKSAVNGGGEQVASGAENESGAEWLSRAIGTTAAKLKRQLTALAEGGWQYRG
jgi:hypothetical protein